MNGDNRINRETDTNREKPIVIVTTNVPSFPKNLIRWGEDVKLKRELDIWPELEQDGDALRLAIGLLRTGPKKRDSYRLSMDPDDLATEKELISKVDFLIKSSCMDWVIAQEFHSLQHGLLAASVIHFGKLRIEKAGPDDMTSAWTELVNMYDKLGLIFEFEIFTRKAIAYIPYEEAIKFFDFDALLA